MHVNNDLFDNIYNAYHPMVMQMCTGFMKGDSDLAKDLTQEVFINAWTALKKFNHASSIKTWIYRITVNTCLKYIRDKKNNIQIPISKDHVCVQDNPPQYSETSYQALYHAIGQLGEVDRLIMMMVLDELEYQEIAGIIGINEVYLRVKISRIKKNLKKIMDHE